MGFMGLMNKMAQQKLDSEIDVARKYLHFSQRDLYVMRFVSKLSSPGWIEDPVMRKFEQVKYWRARYNAACAIEQERENKELDFSIALDQLRY